VLHCWGSIPFGLITRIGVDTPMFKARGVGNDGKDLVMLGLTRDDLDRLQSGKMVKIDTEQLGVDDGPTVFLLFGETAQDAETRLIESFGPPSGPPVLAQGTTRH
jgi:hypothetical protein